KRGIVLAMAAESKEPCHHHLRTAPVARLVDSSTYHLQTIRKINSVHVVPLDTVADRAVNQVGAGKLTRGWGGIGVLVVRDDQNEWKFFNGRLIERFVKRTSG